MADRPRPAPHAGGGHDWPEEVIALVAFLHRAVGGAMVHRVHQGVHVGPHRQRRRAAVLWEVVSTTGGQDQAAAGWDGYKRRLFGR